MYAFFKGKIDSIFEDRIIIDVNDVGYEIYMPENELNSLSVDNIQKIYTYLQVKEDDMKLFGFVTQENLSFFKKLIQVSGVGPKMALGIISNISQSDMCVAIATDDVLTLKSVPGIGPKLAQKIIFELKDKVLKEEMELIKNNKSKNIANNKNSKNVEEATTALQVLGYSEKVIKEVISKLDVSEDKVEDIIRKVLKEMQNI